MKKTTGLITIIVGLIISSCDKKNAVLVNRRTATPGKIKAVEKRKEDEKRKRIEEVVVGKDKIKGVGEIDPNSTPISSPDPSFQEIVNCMPELTNNERTKFTNVLIDPLLPAKARDKLLMVLNEQIYFPAKYVNTNLDFIRILIDQRLPADDRVKLIKLFINPCLPVDARDKIVILLRLGNYDNNRHNYNEFIKNYKPTTLIKVLSNRVLSTGVIIDIIDILSSLSVATDDPANLLELLSRSDLLDPAYRSMFIGVISRYHTDKIRANLVRAFYGLDLHCGLDARTKFIKLLTNTHILATADRVKLINVLASCGFTDRNRVNLVNLLYDSKFFTVINRTHLINILSDFNAYNNDRAKLIHILSDSFFFNNTTDYVDFINLLFILRSTDARVDLMDKLINTYYPAARIDFINMRRRHEETKQEAEKKRIEEEKRVREEAAPSSASPLSSSLSSSSPSSSSVASSISSVSAAPSLPSTPLSSSPSNSESSSFSSSSSSSPSSSPSSPSKSASSSFSLSPSSSPSSSLSNSLSLPTPAQNSDIQKLINAMPRLPDNERGYYTMRLSTLNLSVDECIRINKVFSLLNDLDHCNKLILVFQRCSNVLNDNYPGHISRKNIISILLDDPFIDNLDRFDFIDVLHSMIMLDRTVYSFSSILVDLTPDIRIRAPFIYIMKNLEHNFKLRRCDIVSFIYGLSLNTPITPTCSELIKVLYDLLYNGYYEQLSALMNYFFSIPENFTTPDDYTTYIHNLFILSPENCSKYIEINMMKKTSSSPSSSLSSSSSSYSPTSSSTSSSLTLNSKIQTIVAALHDHITPP